MWSSHPIKVVGKPSSHLLNCPIVFNARIDPTRKVLHFIYSDLFFPSAQSSVICDFFLSLRLSIFSLLRSLPFCVNNLVLWERAEMAEWERACFQSTLKIVNSVIGLVGMSMILYSLWMIRGWFREMSPGSSGSSPPWSAATLASFYISRSS